ncbi:MAG TPA: hypothetical protein VLA26_09620 [Gammaproteobacteria bacterium]|nr:hypothetical protein [Gammaproteobacteria bacterium]
MRPARTQRGAATILAVVFLVISVSLMVVAALNMAGSDITDTALTHDAIEALFLAESGLERVAHAYAGGTPCLDLAPLGPVALGSGQFQITAASGTDFDAVTPLPANQCRIEVLGQAGPRNARRRIAAILQQAATGIQEDFPSAADFASDWTLNVTTDHGGSTKGWSNLFGNAPGSTGGHLIGRTDHGGGSNQTLALTATRDITVPFLATAGMNLELSLYFQKPNENTGGPDQHSLQFFAVDSGGNEYLIWDRSGRENITTWTEVNLTLAVPGAMVGQTIDRIRVVMVLEEQGNNGLAAAVDGIQFGPSGGGGGGGLSLAAWREVVQ